MKRQYPPHLFIAVLLLLVFAAGNLSAQCTSIVFQKNDTKAVHGWITTASAASNYNNWPVIATGQWTSGGNPIQDATVFKYDLSRIPVGSIITSAKLSLYADSIYQGGYTGTPTYGNDNASYLKLVTSAWNPATITWNNQPSISSVNQVYLPQSTNTDQDYLDINVQAFVQGWVNSPSTNYGMELKMITQNYYNSLIFCAANFPDANKWPKLEVCYIPPANAPICVTYFQGKSKAQGAFLDNISPNVPHDFASGYPELFASQWTVNGVPKEASTLVRYDLSQIPVGATITSAKLSLYADLVATNGYTGLPTFGNNNACNLYKVTSPWNPATVTANTQPNYTSANPVLLPQSTSTSQDYTDLDVSAFVQAWVNNPSTNYGMLLKMITQNYYNSMIFYSSGNVDSSKWPKLVVCYEPLPCTAEIAFNQQNLGGGKVQFTDVSTNSTSYTRQWTFYNASGAFTTSSSASPQVTYTGLPPYSARLILNNGSCADTATQAVNITTCVTYQKGNTKGVGGYASSALPNNNYNYPALDIVASQWTFNGTPGEIRGMLKYDLGAIPANAVIVSAKLNLYADTASPDGYRGFPTYGLANASYLQQLTSAWSQSTLTWNTMPTSTATDQLLLPQSSSFTQDYTNIDISKFVQAWVNNPATNYGVLMKIITQNYYNSLIFCSPANRDSSRWPKLEICYFTEPCRATASFTQQHLGGGTVKFTNTSTGLSQYNSLWTFSNKTGIISTSSSANPQFTFTGEPPYAAQLSISAGDCSDDDNQLVNIVNCVSFQKGSTRATGALVESILPNDNWQYNNTNVGIIASQWTYNGVPGEDRGLFKYDLSSIPDNAIIVSAKLSLYADTANPNNGYRGTPTYGTNNASYLKQITSTWNPATVTWNNQPTSTTTNQILFSQSTSLRQDYIDVDVSKFVQTWVASPGSNYGMILDMIGTNYYNSMIFVGPTNVDTAHWPKLDICYLMPAVDNNCITLQQGSGKATGAFLDQYMPNKNWDFAAGYKELLTAQWTVNSVPVEGRTLFKYNLSQIPAGATITSARLSLYADTNAVNGYRGTPTYGTNNASYLYKVTADWNPATVTHITRPTFTTTNGVYLPQSTTTAQDYLDLDVSKFVQDWVNNPASNYGMVLDMIGSQYYNSLIFCSSSYEDPTKWPKLEICYTTDSTCGAHSVFTQQALGGGVVQFNNASSSNAGYYSSWVFYNADGIFATSQVQEPTVTFPGNPPYYASLTVVDSMSAPCYDFSYQEVTLGGATDTSTADTLCGFIFIDKNGDGAIGPGEFGVGHTPIIVDGIVFYADEMGFYSVMVGAGPHTIGVVPPFDWIQTYPLGPISYSITTTTKQHICGFDFGITPWAPTGINDLAIAGNMAIYPNPNNGSRFTVTIPNGFETSNASIHISDIMGREVYVQRVQAQQTQTNISLPETIVEAGMYLVTLKNDHKQLTGRLSVIR